MRILVVRYRFIGDMILTIPFLRNLRYKYPDAMIDMLVAPNSGEVIQNCPYVNNFIFFDTTRKHKYECGIDKKKSFFHYVIRLKQNRYDKAYVLKRSFSSALLCYLAGIKERIGFDTEYRGFLLTKKVKYDKNKHESLCFLDVLKSDGIEVKDSYLENWISDASIKNVKFLLEQNNIAETERYVVINASASNKNKMWNLDNFARVIEYISNEKKLKIIFIGAQSDYKIYQNMKYEKKLSVSPLNLCGSVSIQDSLLILKNASFVIGNDSGNLHMASSVGTPVIGLYGPMPFEKWCVLGENNILLKSNLPCMPCSLKCKCDRNNACMNDIKVETVKNAVDNMCKQTTLNSKP